MTRNSRLLNFGPLQLCRVMLHVDMVTICLEVPEGLFTPLQIALQLEIIRIGMSEPGMLQKHGEVCEVTSTHKTNHHLNLCEMMIYAMKTLMQGDYILVLYDTSMHVDMLP